MRSIAVAFHQASVPDVAQRDGSAIGALKENLLLFTTASAITERFLAVCFYLRAIRGF
jgi:hypothetical protein